ncbi:class I SAM-dependent methyltransferase [soil metagenome]
MTFPEMDKSKIAVDIFDKRASLYQDKFMDVSLYHNSFDLFCVSIQKPTASILELACGPGNITKYLLEKRPGFQIFGIDLAPNMIRFAAINNPSAKFEVMNCRDIHTIEERYDGIMCGFCLPYLSKEEAIKLIGDAALLLNFGGILYLSTMEDDYSKSGFKTGSAGDEMYMHYHQADYLTAALDKNEFKILHLQRQDFPMQDGTKMTDLLIIARKLKQ